MSCDKDSLLLYAVTDRAWLGERGKAASERAPAGLGLAALPQPCYLAG